MTNEHFRPRVGAVFSADIAVPDHARELRFYSRVLCTGERRPWREDLMNSHGMPIVGLGARTDAHAALPLQWMPHIQVADVATSVRRAVELGGTVLMQPGEDAAGMEWAVLLDPNGAAFGLIPVVPSDAIAPVDLPESAAVGRIAWLDLTVRNATATRDFYRDVVGWSPQDLAMNDADGAYADYMMLGPDGAPAAGVCHARGANAELPPVWMIYLPVGDIAESLRHVKEEGGRVVKAVQGAEGDPSYAAVEDPAGVAFALVPV